MTPATLPLVRRTLVGTLLVSLAACQGTVTPVAVASNSGEDAATKDAPVSDDPDVVGGGGPEDISLVVDASGGGKGGCATPAPPMKFGGQAPPVSGRAASTWQPWTSGHPLAVHGDLLLALDPDNGTLVRIDRKAMKVLATLQLGGRPQALTIAPDGTTFVILRQAGTVAKVSAQGELLATWPVGTEPTGLALSPDAQTLYVGVAGDKLLKRLDVSTGQLLGQALTQDHPTAVVADALEVTVLHRIAPPRQFTLANLTATAVFQGQPRTLPGQGMVGMCGDNGPNAQVPAIRALAGVLDPESGAVQVAHLVVSPGNLQTSLTQLQGCTDGASYGSGGNCKVPRRPAEVAVSSLRSDGAVGTFGTQLGVKGGEPIGAWVSQPTDIAAHPTHQVLLIAARGTDNVLLMNTAFGSPTPMGLVQTGQAPSGIAVSDDGATAYVWNAHDFTVAPIDLKPLLTFQAGPALELQQGTPLSIGTDPLPQDARLGRRIFTYARHPGLSKNGQFACATCHAEGAEDGQTWFVAVGPRQTPALAERLAGTAPFNWLGSHQKLADNMADTIHRMGGAGLKPDEVASLEKFLLTGLHAPLNPNVQPGGLTALQAQGKVLFDSPEVGCGGCHVAGLTDGQSHDVGTMSKDDFEVTLQGLGKTLPGLEFDTPSLKGMFATAPYFHDGSAKDLDAVLALSDAGTMGHTGQLTSDQRKALKAYLLSL